MTLVYRQSATGTEHCYWVDCPYCENDIGEHVSFRQHWRNCPQNPEINQ